MSNDVYRDLPRVDNLIEEFSGSLPEPLLRDVIRMSLETARADIAAGREARFREDITVMARALRRGAGVRLINATGVLLHTNLGRARWSQSAADRAAEAAVHACNLELDVRTGERSRRGKYVERLLTTLTGAEDAQIVNNNASALLLVLAAMSRGKSVPVSRGQLIEIGGSYRLPDVMEVSGARLVEVGTTNRTRVGDYEAALQLNDSGAILEVHPSNYRVVGFTESPSTHDLAQLAHGRDLPMIFDQGSGLLDSHTPWLDVPTPDWLKSEPGVRQAISDGADLVLFSGDKLLGGPQAGIIVGRSDLVEQLRRNPLARALRVDGVTLAGLAATLESYARGDVGDIPFWAQATAATADLEDRASKIANGVSGRTSRGFSTIGAGSAPGAKIETALVIVDGGDHLFHRLLDCDEAVLARREDGNLVLDVRTIDATDDSVVIQNVNECR
ncbi:MAG: L-seryl-tRNA(Sec) selenium transferase [Acidimicrobiia bacterium]